MAVRKFVKKRMEELVKGGSGWQGGIAYAKKLVNKPGPSAPGSPPGRDSGDLYKSINGKVRMLFGKSVQGEIYATAAHGGHPYPKYLEEGTSKMAPRPWLKPTFKVMKKRARQIFGRSMTKGEEKEVKMHFRKTLGKKTTFKSIVI